MVVITEKPAVTGFVTKLERVIPRLQALFLVAISGAFGWVILGLGENMYSPFLGREGEPLLPLLSGLFGAPWLIASLLGRVQIPPQRDTRWSPPVIDRIRGTLLASTSGALVGFLPGVSSGVAAAVTGMALQSKKGREETDRLWLFSISGVNTANTVYALVALFVIGRPRSGAVVAIEELLGGTDLNGLLFLLTAMAASGAAGYVLTPWFGKRALSVLERIDYQWFAIGVLVFIALLSLVICGPLGLGVFASCASTGMLPLLWGVRRVALMGCLLVPVMAWFAQMR
jgi:putative membrane protein